MDLVAGERLVNCVGGEIMENRGNDAGADGVFPECSAIKNWPLDPAKGLEDTGA